MLDYHALAPDFIVAGTVLAVLGADLFLPAERKWWSAVLGIFGLTLALIPIFTLAVDDSSLRSMFGGSYVIDDFALVDLDQGCTVCGLPVQDVGTIEVAGSGNDVVLDWSADPAPGIRFAVYKLLGPDFSQAIRVGTTDTRTFVHQNAKLASENYAYRVSAIDPCGNESCF